MKLPYDIQMFYKFSCLFLATFFFLTSGLFAQYRIEGTIKGASEMTMVLNSYYGDMSIATDTAITDKHGKIIFQGNENLHEGLYNIKSGKWQLDFIISAQQFTFETDFNQSIEKINFNNSDENEVYYQYLKFILSKYKQIDSLKKQMPLSSNNDSGKDKIRALKQSVHNFRTALLDQYSNTFAIKIIKAGMPPTQGKVKRLPDGKIDTSYAVAYARSHLFDGIDYHDARMLYTPFYFEKIDSYLKSTPHNKDSIRQACDDLMQKAKQNDEIYKYTARLLTDKYHYISNPSLEALYVHLVEKYFLNQQTLWQDSALIARLSKNVQRIKPLLPGEKAPELTLPDSTGKLVSMHGIQSKYTILYFWDSDCSHCQETTPLLHNIYEKNKAKEIIVYSVPLELKENGWKKFIHEHNIKDWIHVWDPLAIEGIFNKYNIITTPSVFVLDERKKILLKNIQMDELDKYFADQNN